MKFPKVIHRCLFCEGEIKKHDSSNPFCRRKECFEMRLKHASEHTNLVLGKVIGNKRVCGYLITERKGGTRDSKPI